MTRLYCSSYLYLTLMQPSNLAATHHHGEVGADFGEAERVAELVVSEGELRAPAPGVSLRLSCAWGAACHIYRHRSHSIA